jgi:DNA-directed RNA polymerase specialized sigma24 family protein
LGTEDEGESKQAGTHALLPEHGELCARVAMALLGDQAGVERALEHVARDAAGVATGTDASGARANLLGLVRAACAAQSARSPVRLTTRGGAQGEAPASARKKLSRLRPTEREALVLHLVGGLDARGVAVACGASVTEDVARTRIASAISQLLEEEDR